MINTTIDRLSSQTAVCCIRWDSWEPKGAYLHMKAATSSAFLIPASHLGHADTRGSRALSQSYGSRGPRNVTTISDAAAAIRRLTRDMTSRAALNAAEGV